MSLTLVALSVALFAAGFAAATIRAASPAATATTPTATTTGTTTASGITTALTTTTTPTTNPTTSTEPTTVQTPPVGTVSRPITGRCLLAGGLAVLTPGRLPLVLGPVAQAPGATSAGLGAFSYPADGSIVTGSGVDLRTSGCGGPRPAGGNAAVQSLSLFDGAVTAQRVELGVHADKPGRGSAVSGLTIGGNPVTAHPRLELPIENWGYAVALAPAAPAPGKPGSLEVSALAIHIVEPHDGLAPGTVLLVAFAGLPPSSPGQTPRTGTRTRSLGGHAAPTPHRKHKSVKKQHHPLKVTPPLGLHRYVFPVVGSSDYVDTYGAFRSDVPGKWHHGDDIFAPLGTPVVAVASGTVNRVGWETIGGWRLWVRDSLRNEFYYAHLSGYAPAVLHSNRVKAGEVIGFIGNTGDAFTTSPHLHFEIHPHTLLRLDYDGAVDPTSYLDHWFRLSHARAPRPAHPRLPTGAVRREARYVFRELLAARHLIKHAPLLSERPHVHVRGSNGSPLAAARYPPAESSSLVPTSGHSRHGLSTLGVGLLAALASLALFALTIAPPLRRRIARRPPRPPST